MCVCVCVRARRWCFHHLSHSSHFAAFFVLVRVQNTWEQSREDIMAKYDDLQARMTDAFRNLMD